MNLFCEDCNVISCGLCFALEHTNHKMKHASQYFGSVRDKLERNLKTKKDVMENIISQSESNVKNMIVYEEKSLRIKQQIQERGERMKNFIDSIVVELHEQVDELLSRQKTKLGELLKKLEVLEKNLSEKIEDLEKQLDGLNYENVVRISSQIEEEHVIIPMHYKNFDVSLSPEKEYEMVLKEILGSIFKGLMMKY